jgi:arginine/lysine/ornithine decarboxylase
VATGSRPGLGGDDLPISAGIPIVAPGELLDDAIVDYLQQLAADGVISVPEQRIAELAQEVIERRSRADTFGPDAGRAGSDS